MKKTQVIIKLVLFSAIVSTCLKASFAAPNETHGAISITFDDGKKNQYDYAFPLMQARGIVGTFYVVTDRIRDFSQSNSYMSIAELQTLRNQGSEIGSHGKTHAALTSISDSQIRSECSISKQTLQSYGFAVNNFAYPYGGTNEHVDSIVSQYYKSARGAYNGRIIQFPVSPFSLPGYRGETGKPNVLSQLKSAVDQVYSSKGWSIFFFHNIIPNDNTHNYTISEQDFASFLDYVVYKGVPTITVNQGVNLSSPPNLPPSVSINPTSVNMIVGQSKTFSSSVLGGNHPYSYQWYLNDTLIPNATNSTWKFKPTSTGNYKVYLWVTDSLNFKAQSNVVTDIFVGREQYHLICRQTGLDSSATGTVVTIDNSAKTFTALPFSEKIDAGSLVNYNYEAIVSSSVSGKRFRLNTISGEPSPITVTSNTTVTGNYVKQYYLTVNSAYSTLGGEGWYDAGSSVYLTLTNGNITRRLGSRHVFTGWSGDASGTGLKSNAFIMDGPRTATANWKTQYYLTVSTNFGSVSPSSNWYDMGTNIEIFAVPPDAKHNVRYVWNGWTDTVTGHCTVMLNPAAININGSTTQMASWKPQFKVVFQQTGLPVGSATRVTVNSVLHMLPYFDWFDKGASINFAYEEATTASAFARNILTATSNQSPLAVEAPTTVTGHYETQYAVELSAVISAIVILGGLNSAIILLKRRKTKRYEIRGSKRIRHIIRRMLFQ